MRGAAGGHRRPKDSFANPQPPPPTPLFNRLPRDSDASFASSRPSSAGVGRSSAASVELYKDHRFQAAAVSTINAYLSSHSSLSLRLPIPSAKDITQTLSFLLSRLDFPNPKLDDDLPLVLKSLNYPFKLNKSILRSPGTPHQWPTFLAIIHWLVQIAKFYDHGSSNPTSFADHNPFLSYTVASYSHYIDGDDDMVEKLDRDLAENLEKETEIVKASVGDLESQAREMEAKIEAMRSEPSPKEALEKQKGLLEEDVMKFNEMVEKLTEKIAELERGLEEREKALEEKVAEKDRVCEENEELRKRVEAQTVNSRDVERMRRELQAVEREIGDAEVTRNTWEEKSWDLDATLGQKFKEIEALAMESNQAMRRLKFGEGFQYALNAKGSTPTEVMGIDNKSTLKPSLDSFADELKKNSMAKFEELINLRQQSSVIAAKVEGKKNRQAKIDSRIDEVEAQLHLLRKETQEYSSRCEADAKKMGEDIETEARNLDIVDREAAEILKASELKLQEEIKQSEEETQKCAFELMALLDSISKYKERTQSKLVQLKHDISETIAAVSDAYKGSLQTQFGSL